MDDQFHDHPHQQILQKVIARLLTTESLDDLTHAVGLPALHHDATGEPVRVTSVTTYSDDGWHNPWEHGVVVNFSDGCRLHAGITFGQPPAEMLVWSTQPRIAQPAGPGSRHCLCGVCRGADTFDRNEEPSLSGEGTRTTLRCRRCGSTETHDPDSRARPYLHRAAWPPATGAYPVDPAEGGSVA